jgi:hypothetical protein
MSCSRGDEILAEIDEVLTFLNRIEVESVVAKKSKKAFFLPKHSFDGSSDYIIKPKPSFFWDMAVCFCLALDFNAYPKTVCFEILSKLTEHFTVPPENCQPTNNFLY